MIEVTQLYNLCFVYFYFQICFNKDRLNKTLIDFIQELETAFVVNAAAVTAVTDSEEQQRYKF